MTCNIVRKIRLDAARRKKGKLAPPRRFTLSRRRSESPGMIRTSIPPILRLRRQVMQR